MKATYIRYTRIISFPVRSTFPSFLRYHLRDRLIDLHTNLKRITIRNIKNRDKDMIGKEKSLVSREIHMMKYSTYNNS